MQELTDRQQQVLDFIKSYIGEYEISPSILDIAAEFEIYPTAVVDHLAALQKKGKIKLLKRVARGIVVKEDS